MDYNTARKFQEIDEDDENYPNVKGVWLEEDYIRTYPYETLACDVIGFTSDGNVGTNGIEASYNSILNGTDGREYGYQDESASLERTVKEPESGNTVVSTIDLQVQSVVEKYVLEFNEEHKNQARTGEGSANTAVMVMKSPERGDPGGSLLPNYDLNSPRDLTKYYTQEEIDAMDSEGKSEALNTLWNISCVNQVYEPDLHLSLLPFQQV